MSTVYIVFLIYRWLEIYLLYMRDSFIIILYFKYGAGYKYDGLTSHYFLYVSQYFKGKEAL
jgi:hypothetical protein